MFGTEAERERTAAGSTGRRLAVLVAVVVTAMTVGALLLHRVNGRHEVTDWWLDNALNVVSFTAPGVVLAYCRPRNPLGWLLLVAGVAQGFTGITREYLVWSFLHEGRAPGAAWLFALGDPAFQLSMATLPLALLLFPTGRLRSPRWRFVVGATIVTGSLLYAVSVLDSDPWPTPGGPTRSPLAVESLSGVLSAVAAIAGLAVIAVMVAALVCFVLRFRASTGVERAQLEWLGFAAVLALAEGSFEMVVSSPVQFVAAPLAVALVGTAIAVAVLRYRLLDIDVVLNRTLVYGTLTVVVTGGYVGVVEILSAALRRHVDLGVSLVATALVALLFAPLRHVIQRAVDRLLYGDRRDPYRAIARLGRRLGEPAQAGPSLASVVEEVAKALRVDDAAVELEGDGLVATFGDVTAPGRARVAVPLVLAGESLGHLHLGRQGRGEVVSRAQAQLVDDLARQVAVIAYAARLTGDLQRSRAELITAVEDERRRLRRDLHDGLGPSLAAVTLKLDAARLLVADDPRAAADALVRVKEDVRHTIADLRRLVYGLRPPALDELGLVGALRARALDFGPSLHVDFAADDPFPELPAAVEVAVYRIAAEALTNVARHAKVRECRLRIAVNGAVELEVTDGGAGMPAGWTGGVGIRSLFERTAELGGTCTVESTPGQGTRVRAILPLGHEEKP